MLRKLTQERLKELLHYDSETGIFTRLVSRPNCLSGSEAGHIEKCSGYRRIRIDNRLYKASRLAWLYVEGYFPEHEVDHENRISHDDRWENLRPVSHQCNMRNCKIRTTNKSGITGVCWFEESRKWISRIMISGKQLHLGLFRLKLDAAHARWNAEVKYNFPGCNSTSSARLYIQEHKGNGNNCAFS